MRPKEKVANAKYLFTLHVNKSQVLMSTSWKIEKYTSNIVSLSALFADGFLDGWCLAPAWNNYVSLQKQGIFNGIKSKMVKMSSNIKITTKTQQSNPREEQNQTSTNHHKAYSDNISASGNKKDFIYIFLISSKEISTILR